MERGKYNLGTIKYTASNPEEKLVFSPESTTPELAAALVDRVVRVLASWHPNHMQFLGALPWRGLSRFVWLPESHKIGRKQFALLGTMALEILLKNREFLSETDENLLKYCIRFDVMNLFLELADKPIYLVQFRATNGAFVITQSMNMSDEFQTLQPRFYERFSNKLWDGLRLNTQGPDGQYLEKELALLSMAFLYKYFKKIGFRRRMIDSGGKYLAPAAPSFELQVIDDNGDVIYTPKQCASFAKNYERMIRWTKKKKRFVNPTTEMAARALILLR